MVTFIAALAAACYFGAIAWKNAIIYSAFLAALDVMWIAFKKTRNEPMSNATANRLYTISYVLAMVGVLGICIEGFSVYARSHGLI
jgi:hypothetical protein